MVGFGIFGLEIVWVQKLVKWVILPSKYSLATVKQVSKRFTKKVKYRKFPQFYLLKVSFSEHFCPVLTTPQGTSKMGKTQLDHWKLFLGANVCQIKSSDFFHFPY